MRDRFAGKVVAITGAASGFGAEAARRFAAEGARLSLSDIDGDAVSCVADALGTDTMANAVDVRDEVAIATQITRTLERFGRLDIAINNAGVCHMMKPITALTLDEYENTMAVNARSVFLGMKHQLLPMIEQGDGAILNIASAAGLVGAGQLSAYAASKHAVVGLTRAVADEVARKGIRVNALCPSFASTPLLNEIADCLGDRHGINREEASQRIASRIPMRRMATIDEVVQAMLWICDPENSFMTGQAVSIDGGLTAI